MHARQVEDGLLNDAGFCVVAGKPVKLRYFIFVLQVDLLLLEFVQDNAQGCGDPHYDFYLLVNVAHEILQKGLKEFFYFIFAELFQDSYKSFYSINFYERVFVV